MKTINKKASTPPETSVSASIQESIYYYCLSQLTANTVFTSLFIAEICVKTMLFDMLFTWHPTYSTQFLRTVLHLVAFCEWFAFRCENDFVTFVLSVQQIVPNNQLDNQKRLCSEVCNHSLSHRFALHRFTSHSTPRLSSLSLCRTQIHVNAFVPVKRPCQPQTLQFPTRLELITTLPPQNL